MTKIALDMMLSWKCVRNVLVLKKMKRGLEHITLSESLELQSFHL